MSSPGLLESSGKLARNTTLEVNYIGTHAIHLLDRRQIAQPNAIPSDSLAFCQEQVNGHLRKSRRGSLQQCQPAALPELHNIYINSDWHGYSHYNAMNVKFEHRAHDLAVTAVYTWANSKDDKSAAAGVGATRRRLSGIHGQPQPAAGLRSVRLRRRPAVRAELRLRAALRPRQEMLGNGVNRATDLLIGGWETTGIATFQTGFPYSFYRKRCWGAPGHILPAREP